MTTFSFTSGNPNNLIGGSAASMADIQGPFTDLRTFVNGSISDINIASNAAIAESKLATGSSGLAKGTFKAYRNAALSLASNSTVVFDTDSGSGFDVSGWYDTTTGRFTPQVAGYYQLSWVVAVQPAAGTDMVLITTLRKNGTPEAQGLNGTQRIATTTTPSGGSVAVVANGSTDYFEINMQHTIGGSVAIQTGLTATYFSGHLIGRT